MDNSKIPSEYWILLALKNVSERHGLSLLSWYHTGIPDEFDIGYRQFLELLDEMETNGLIKPASQKENYCLTDKGKKEATRFKKKLKLDDYYLLFSIFPEIELKERIETFENIVMAAFGLFFTMDYIKRVSSFNISDLNIVLILSVLIFIYVFATYYFIINFSKMIVFRIMGLHRNTLWIYKEWLWKNQNKIIYTLTFLIVIIPLFIVYSMNIVQLDSIIWGLTLLGISQIILEREKIHEKIKLKFEIYFKP